MRLQEAITDGSMQLEVKRRLGKSYQADALKLLIEAGEFIDRNRGYGVGGIPDLLLGETED